MQPTEHAREVLLQQALEEEALAHRLRAGFRSISLGKVIFDTSTGEVVRTEPPGCEPFCSCSSGEATPEEPFYVDPPAAPEIIADVGK